MSPKAQPTIVVRHEIVYEWMTYDGFTAYSLRVKPELTMSIIKKAWDDALSCENVPVSRDRNTGEVIVSVPVVQYQTQVVI